MEGDEYNRVQTPSRTDEGDPDKNNVPLGKLHALLTEENLSKSLYSTHQQQQQAQCMDTFPHNSPTTSLITTEPSDNKQSAELYLTTTYDNSNTGVASPLDCDDADMELPLFPEDNHFRPINAVEGAAGHPDDNSSRNLRDRSNRKPIQERVRQKRQTLQDMTRSLKQWLYHHRDNPYPSKSEKVQLAKSSQMTMTQVSNWFANARRRLKNTVRGPELSWAKRIKLYNNCIEGNQELLSVGSSSSDDDLTGELTTGDTEQNCDLDADCAPRVPDIQERLSEQCHQAEISDTSALDDQGERKEDNLQARLQGDSHSAPQPQAFDLHKTSAPWNFSTIKQQPSCQKNIMIPLVLDAKQTTSTLSALPLLPTSQSTDLPATQEQPNQAISGFGENIGDSGDTHPKYKQTIMQRYLTDSYNSYQNALLSLSTPVNKDPKENERHRNPSGSLSSHDYEEYMSSASSARSTPTREHQEGHLDEYEEFSRHWPDIKTRAEDDLYWKEISAALALTSLARSRHPAQSQ